MYAILYENPKRESEFLWKYDLETRDDVSNFIYDNDLYEYDIYELKHIGCSGASYDEYDG